MQYFLSFSNMSSVLREDIVVIGLIKLSITTTSPTILDEKLNLLLFSANLQISQFSIISSNLEINEVSAHQSKQIGLTKVQHM